MPKKKVDEFEQVLHALNIVHVTPLFAVEGCDEAFCPFDQAQSVVVASMQRARKRSKRALVTLATAVFPEDAKIIPPDFRRLADLNRSTLSEYPRLTLKFKLPFIGDIIGSLERSEVSYDYAIYTNSDIIVHADFYEMVVDQIVKGFDGFVINRQTLPKGPTRGRLFNSLDLDMIYASKGNIHPGADCFVLKKNVLRRFTTGDLFLGFAPVGQFLKVQTMIFSQSFKQFLPSN